MPNNGQHTAPVLVRSELDLCKDWREETPDNNQTGPVQARAHWMVGPGLARGEGHADSHSGGPKKLRHGPDNLKSK